MADADAGRRRTRTDGFGEERKLLFLAALRQGYAVLTACRLVGISNRTAYNHRRADPDFAEQWLLARRMATLPLDLLAFGRAVDGVEEPVYAYGKLVHVGRRRSDSLLAALLAGQQPEKYGRGAGTRVQAGLARRVKRLARRLKALEGRLEAEQARTIRSGELVNVVNRPVASAVGGGGRSRGGRKPAGWRLAAARRRAPGPEISPLAGQT